MKFLSSFREREVILCLLILFIFILTSNPSLASKNRTKIIDKLDSQKNMAIDDIGDFDSDDRSEVGYIGNNSVYVIDSKGQREKISSDGSFRDVEGFHKWDSDFNTEIFWYSSSSYGEYAFMKDYLSDTIKIFANDYVCDYAPLAYGILNSSEYLAFHFKTDSYSGTVKSRSNLYLIPKSNSCVYESSNDIELENCPYQVYNGSFSPWLPNGLAISDLDNDNESELIGIQDDKNLVWYNFYNSSENHLGNAFELMDETYDMDRDGLEEIFYVDAQNNLSWTDVNRENRTTSIKATKLGGIGNWDQDEFKELSFIDPQGVVKIFDLYQLLATKNVLSDRIGLNQEITIGLKIDNHRRKEALNISISDTIPKGFRPPSKDMKVNISKGNKKQEIEAILAKRGENLRLSVTHFSSSLLEELDPQEKLYISYRLITPQIPGSYTIPGAKVYWLEF